MENKGLVATSGISEEVRQRCAKLSIKIKEAPMPGKSIIIFPQEWIWNQQAKQATHTVSGEVIQFGATPQSQIKIDSVFFGVN